MNSFANAGSTPNVERLKYTTESFVVLQGLTSAVFGAAYACQQVIDLYWHGSSWRGLGILLMAGAMVSMFIYIPRYYASRFGWVQQREALPAVGLLPSVIALLIVVALLIPFVIWISANVLQSLVHLPVNFLTLLQSLGFLCLILSFAAFSARARTMPVRLAVWAALAVVQGLIAVFPLWIPLNLRQLVLWKLLNAGSLGIFIMVVGLCNHITLVRLLPKT